MTRLTLLAPVFALILAAGCDNPKTTETTVSPGMVNSTCPMSGKALSDDCPTTTWKGDTVGFCGPGCKTTFEGKTPAEKDAEVAKMKQG